MLKLTRLVAAMAIAFLALPAAAGSWPNIPARKAPPKAVHQAPQAEESSESLGQRASASPDGFEFVGGDAGWQLAQHKYVRSDGRFMHSNECDHAKRMAQAVSPRDVEDGRKLSPGG